MSQPKHRRKPSVKDEPINIEELENSPTLKGMLSFLQTPPEVYAERFKQAALPRHTSVEAEAPPGLTPPGSSYEIPRGYSTETPSNPSSARTPRQGMDDQYVRSTVSIELPAGDLRQNSDPEIICDLPPGTSLLEEARPRQHSEVPAGTLPPGTSQERRAGITHRSLQVSSSLAHRSYEEHHSTGESLAGVFLTGKTFFFEGVGKRRPYYCRTAQDGHSPAEQTLYDFFWKKANAKISGGYREPNGSFLVNAAMSEITEGIHCDRKQAKALLESLIAKLAIEVVREPDFKRQIPTRYRIYTYSQILRRRKDADLLYAVRNRGVKFISSARIHEIATEEPGGDKPAGNSQTHTEVPAGLKTGIPTGLGPETPAGVEPRGFLIEGIEARKYQEKTSSSDSGDLIRKAIQRHLNIPIDDDAIHLIQDRCRRNVPDTTDEEIAELAEFRARYLASMIRAKPTSVPSPVGALITGIPKDCSGRAVTDIRKRKAELDEELRDLEKSNIPHS